MTVLICILLFILSFSLVMVSLFYVREINRTKYYQELLIKIINNDDIIRDSIETICTAYGLEEGDLLDYISKRSKKE